MSRKDTILIAALINAGLLIVLFASALKTPASPKPLQEPIAALPAPLEKATELPLRREAKTTAGDEVDHALSRLKETPPATPAPIAAPLPEPAFDIQPLAAAPQTPITSTPPAPIVAAPPSETASDIIEVTVKKGDFLEKIARANHTTVEEIMKLNHLSSTRLSIGQVLKVKPGSKKQSVKEQAPKQAANEAQYYTVKNGDNPWTIAVKNHLKLEELLRLNGLDEEKARRLKPGDKLRIK